MARREPVTMVTPTLLVTSPQPRFFFCFNYGGSGLGIPDSGPALINGKYGFQAADWGGLGAVWIP